MQALLALLNKLATESASCALGGRGTTATAVRLSIEDWRALFTARPTPE